MSDRFDELIRSSAAEMPDPGEFRRLNRVTLRDHIARSERTARRRHAFLVAAASLALMVVFSGRLNQLGSDDFDTETTAGVDALGNPATLHKDLISGSTMVFRGNDEEAKELIQQQAAGEGTLFKVDCLEYMGKSNWTFVYFHVVNGQEKIANTIYNPEGYPRADLPNEEHFARTYLSDLYGLVRYAPPVRQYMLEIEGTPILMKTWKKWYPGYGEVTYSRGLPLE